MYKFGCDGINRYAYDVLFILQAKHGSRMGENLWYPLPRFMNRAATPAVKRLLTVDLDKIVSALERGGSIEDGYKRLERLAK